MEARSKVAPLARIRPIPNDPTLATRLRAKVDRSAGRRGCWPFTGARQSGGYGVLHTGGRRGRTVYAHRVAWRLHHGRDPGSFAVCHRCDNPPCCNPGHLFLGSVRDNVADMISKGRKARTMPPRVRGEAVGTSRLTSSQVREIRARAAAGEGSGKLGAAFGIDSSTVRQIVRRVIWRHVGEA